MVIRPQPGPQEAFLASPADIVVYGGAAGGGKTWGLLIDPLRHVNNPGFTATIFRRKFTEITEPGGMWAESFSIYPLLHAVPKETDMQWRFPKGATVRFSHMQHEKDRYNWLGAQICMLGFDQLERFTDDQFFYMLSRNRSLCGVRPYVRATANPEPGWLAVFLAWWIDQDTGLPIPERCGVLRWFVRQGNRIVWADTPGELKRDLVADDGEPVLPKSVTFIKASIQDNPALLNADPGYLANLHALPHIERERLLGGNWKINSRGGEWPPDYFGRELWFEDFPHAKHIALWAMSLDPSKGKDAKAGDYRAYVWGALDFDGVLWVDADLAREPTPALVETGFEIYGRLVKQSGETGVAGFGIETNTWQELLATEFMRVSSQRQVVLPVYGFNNYVNKQVRIRRLGPWLAQRRLRFRANSPGTRLLVDQLMAFGEDSKEHDDGPDGLEMLCRLVTHIVTGGRGAESDQPGLVRT